MCLPLQVCKESEDRENSNEEGPHQNLGSQLIEVVSLVLSNEDDEDGQLVVLQMVDDLLSKAGPLLLDHCARLGVFSQVGILGGAHEPAQPLEIKDAANVSYEIGFMIRN